MTNSGGGPEPGDRHAGVAGDSPQSAESAQGTPPYTMPAHLTPGGLHAFTMEVAHFANELGAELDRQALESLSRGGNPEHTAEAVSKARRAYDRRLQMDAIEQVAVESDETTQQSDWSIFSAILVTVATVGLGVMPNFLHSPWQRGLFIGLVVVGMAGLGLMWGGRRRRRGRARR